MQQHMQQKAAVWKVLLVCFITQLRLKGSTNRVKVVER
jgi:hypothetical protein